MQSGQRRWIPDAETFNAMGLDWSNIKYFPINDVDTIPPGQDFPSKKNGNSVNSQFDINNLVASIPYYQWQQFAKQSIPLILDECKASGITDLGQIAYILATSEHESHCGQLITELWDPTADQLTYDGRLGNDQPGDGFRYRGRGYTQITGKGNYRDWSNRLGVDLVSNPERATEPAIAAKIIVQGMRDGTFTTEKLGDYIDGSQQNFYGARAIVNGDKSYVTNIYNPKTNGQGIAEIAQRYLNILKTGSSNNTGINPQNPSPSDPPDFKGKVKPNTLNIRSGPGTNYDPPISFASKGTELTFDGWTNGTSVYDEEAKANDDSWFRIKGTNSWVASALINGNPPANSRYIDPNSIAPPSGGSNNGGGNNSGGNSISSGLPTSAASASTHFRKQPPNSADCGPSSLAMTISALGVTPSDVSSVRSKMPEFNNSPWTSFEEIHGGIKNLGKSSTEFRNWEDFDSHLSKGHPLVMFGLSSQTWAAQFPGGHPGSYVPHFVAILGKTNDGKYIVGDPLYNKPVEMDRNQLKAFIPNVRYDYEGGGSYTFNPDSPDAIAVF